MDGAPLVIATRDLTKRFGPVLALDHLDLDVSPRRGSASGEPSSKSRHPPRAEL